METKRTEKFILWFKELNIEDVGLVGGKNASLGEMYQQLTSKNVKIPNGFAVSAYAYHYFLKKAGIDQTVKDILNGLDITDITELQKRGAKVRSTIEGATLPEELEKEILEAYHQMEKEYGDFVDCAVRSSATAEDLPDASFAGQQETFLNVRGDVGILDCCKKCFASLFTNRAISYRQSKGFDHFSVGLSIGVQKMVRASEGCSGVMFTLDTESGFKHAILVTGSWGLGENIVQGSVNPDEWIVFKKTLKTGHKPIIKKKLGEKQLTMVYSTKGTSKLVKNLITPTYRKEVFCLNDEQVLTLATYGQIIEDHYSMKHKRECPMDIEWALDSRDNEIYIVQARPETVHSSHDKTKIFTYSLKESTKSVKKLATGNSVGKKIGSGKAVVIKDVDDINNFIDGGILITDMTDPNWEPILKKASGVVTNRGGRTCHAAIISRELGIPCIVGTSFGTEKITSGQDVTVDCSQGVEGIVWEGIIPFQVKNQDLDIIPKTRTHICMNIGNPEHAFDSSFLPNDGVGLVRMEFIVANHIKVHPQALLHPEKIKEEDKEKISKLTKGYKEQSDYFVDQLSQGVGMIAAAFYPKPVILRFSDFKTNEYSTLLGGSNFEPKEENPMLGWRGASRYYSSYKDGFALECKAVKKIREEFGLTNLIVMIPFCRTVEEAKKVIQEMEKNNLKRTKENGLKIYGMCEIPSNVLLAEEFLEYFDGYSIGSNDLTQLTLGVDRDSDTVSHIYDERNPAVKKLISQVIKVCREKGKYIGICGQAPSDYPEFTQFLVEEGIESISLNPDTVISARILTAEKEK
eukprot:gene4036-7325_t